MLRFAAFTNVPWFLPGVALSIVLGFRVRRRVGTWLGVSQEVAWAAVVSLGVIAFATLTPLHEAALNGGIRAPGCDFSRVGLASLDQILDFNDAILNILLFMPLGAILAIVPRSRRKALLMGGAVALPFIIETTQLLAVPLDRACQSADVIDNLTGLFVGFAIGSIGMVLRSFPKAHTEPRPD